MRYLKEKAEHAAPRAARHIDRGDVETVRVCARQVCFGVPFDAQRGNATSALWRRDILVVETHSSTFRPRQRGVVRE